MTTVKTRFLILSDTHCAAPLAAKSPGDTSAPLKTTTRLLSTLMLKPKSRPLRRRRRLGETKDKDNDGNDDEDDDGVYYRAPLPACDVLLHAGDITQYGLVEEYEEMIAVLAACQAEIKIVVAGNHDVSLDRDFYVDRGGGTWLHGEKGRQDVDKVRELWVGEEARRMGIVYVEEGIREFVLKSGAKFTIYTSPYQPEHTGWGFQYKLDEDRYNPSSSLQDGTAKNPANPVPFHPQIDIMMTHGPPRGRLDVVRSNRAVGCPHLLRAVERARPRLHCFGHIHESWGAERIRWKTLKNETSEASGPEDPTTDEASTRIESVHRYNPTPKQLVADRTAFIDASVNSAQPLVFGQETLFVNASIMNVAYEPVHAPWLVDLDLPLEKTAVDADI